MMLIHGSEGNRQPAPRKWAPPTSLSVDSAHLLTDPASHRPANPVSVQSWTCLMPAVTSMGLAGRHDAAHLLEVGEIRRIAASLAAGTTDG